MKPLPRAQEMDEGADKSEELKIITRAICLDVATKLPGDKVWFYLDKSNQQQGPVYFSALKSLWKEEKITSETYVWSENMPQWMRIRDLKDFENYLLK